MAISIVLFLVTVALLCMLFFGLIKPGKVFLGAANSRMRTMKIYGGAAFACFVIWVVSLPSQEIQKSSISKVSTDTKVVDSVEKPKSEVDVLTESVLKINKDIKILHLDVGVHGKYMVTIEYAPKSIWSSSNYVFSVGDTMYELGKVFKKAGVKVGRIQILASAPSVDKYGNSSSALAMKIVLQGEEFEKINWDNIYAGGILNLVEADVTYFGDKAVIDYCSDEDHLSQSHAFCKTQIIKQSMRLSD